MQAKNKARTKAEKAAKALQAAVREENINKVRIKEKAQMQAQKKKEAPKSKALKSLLAQN
jgi:hypothetical protein